MSDPVYHLCVGCRSQRDWASDEVKARGRRNRELHESDDPAVRARAHRCIGHAGHGRRCGMVINPLLRLCTSCSHAHELCQHCQKPIAASGEAEATPAEVQEAHEELIDLYTVLAKTFGYGGGGALLRENADDVGGRVIDVLAFSLSALEARVPTRPGLRRLYGQGHYTDLPIRCASGDCSPPQIMHPAMSKAVQCGHWTHGAYMLWCLFCAIKHKRCPVCDASMTPSEP